MKQNTSMTSKFMGIAVLAMMMTLLLGFAFIPAAVKAEEAPTTGSGQTTPAAPAQFLTCEGKQSGNKITLKWGTVPGVTTYKVYGNYVGKAMKLLKVANVSTKGATIKKLNKKKLIKKKVFKFKILAYNTVDGKETLVIKSPVVYIAGSGHKKYTNAKTLKVASTNFNLQKGMTAKISPKLTRVSKKKDLLPLSCGPKISYFNTNKNVAEVGLDGTITAKEAGTSSIYVYTHNGKFKKVNVTVQ